MAQLEGARNRPTRGKAGWAEVDDTMERVAVERLTTRKAVYYVIFGRDEFQPGEHMS